MKPEIEFTITKKLIFRLLTILIFFPKEYHFSILGQRYKMVLKKA